MPRTIAQERLDAKIETTLLEAVDKDMTEDELERLEKRVATLRRLVS